MPSFKYPAEILRGFHQLFQENSGNPSNWATTPSFPSHSPSTHLPTLYTDSPRFTQQLYSGKFSASWPWRKLEFYIRLVKWMCKYKGVRLKNKLQNTATRSAAAYQPRACVVAQQYSSTIFFRAFIPARKHSAYLSKSIFYFIFLICLSLKLWNL